MNRRGFMRAILPAAATPFLARITSAQGKQIPTIELDINSNSWSAGWADTTRVNMEYSNAHQHTNGRQLEFSMAQHSRRPGDNTGVRWADFTASGAPTMGYYWPNNDTSIAEHDNFPTAYLPWKGWVALFGSSSAAKPRTGQKIISIDGTPSAIFRNLDGSGQSITDYVDVVYPTGAGLTSLSPSNRYFNANYNPACWVNPSGTMTGWWGGGYGNNFPNGHGSLFKLLDDNPNYPATSTKPLRLRIFRPTGKPSPTHMRHMVQIGNWLYWGGGYINPDSGSIGTAEKLRNDEFYRIYIPDLASNIFTQEQITSAAAVTLYPGLPNIDNNVRFNLLCADQTRKWLIYMNVNGVYRHKVPTDDGNDGVWEGPYTFGMTSDGWAETISEGAVNTGGSSNWHGLIGTHRSDLGQTFFRYNLSKKWNRIRWS